MRYDSSKRRKVTFEDEIREIIESALTKCIVDNDHPEVAAAVESFKDSDGIVDLMDCIVDKVKEHIDDTVSNMSSNIADKVVE